MSAPKLFDGRHDSGGRDAQSFDAIPSGFRRPPPELGTVESIQSAFAADPAKARTVMGQRPHRALQTAFLAERANELVLGTQQPGRPAQRRQHAESASVRRATADASGVLPQQPV